MPREAPVMSAVPFDEELLMIFSPDLSCTSPLEHPVPSLDSGAPTKAYSRNRFSLLLLFFAHMSRSAVSKKIRGYDAMVSSEVIDLW
jgi:hypothetical protein